MTEASDLIQFCQGAWLVCIVLATIFAVLAYAPWLVAIIMLNVALFLRNRLSFLFVGGASGICINMAMQGRA